jgi:ABC-type uncharacterized transport system substrate-binding protein
MMGWLSCYGSSWRNLRRHESAGIACWTKLEITPPSNSHHSRYGTEETDPTVKDWLSRFLQGLSELGWVDGRNVKIELRWGGSSVDRTRAFAKELIDLQPDVIFSSGTPATAALQRETRTIPIVFVTVAEPIGAGFVASLSHPGGNITGFMFQEASMGGKLLELLSEIAPGVKRAAAVFNPETAPYVEAYYLSPFEGAAHQLKVAPVIAPVRSDSEIEAVITSLGREPGGGLVAMPDAFMVLHRATIISLAARYGLPAVHSNTSFARDGGLLSYGPENGDVFHRAASYVDRILRGESPAGLPVQLPTKFEMVFNAKTAKALGLDVPQSFYWRADEVIE